LTGTHVEKRLVQPGIMKDDRVEILTGIREGEIAVTGKAYRREMGWRWM